MSSWFLRLHVHDERILHALVLRRWRWGDLLMNLVTRLGDAVTTLGITLALMISPFPSLQAIGLFAAVALTSSHLGVQALKRTINRARPRLPVGCASMISAPDQFSFPSGHAAASLSVGIAVASALPGPAAVATVALSTLVGVSRCYLGVHYPGDVIVGWLLAISACLVATLLL